MRSDATRTSKRAICLEPPLADMIRPAGRCPP
jgi:hypothetical protein